MQMMIKMMMGTGQDAHRPRLQGAHAQGSAGAGSSSGMGILKGSSADTGLIGAMKDGAHNDHGHSPAETKNPAGANNNTSPRAVVDHS